MILDDGLLNVGRAVAFSQVLNESESWPCLGGLFVTSVVSVVSILALSRWSLRSSDLGGLFALGLVWVVSSLSSSLSREYSLLMS
jgi:hypothetical protein